jgi:hypothetical protein
VDMSLARNLDWRPADQPDGWHSKQRSGAGPFGQSLFAARR